MRGIAKLILIASLAVVLIQAHHHFVLQSEGIFAVRIYNSLSENEGNIVFSPLSAHAGLSLIYQGAEGSTKEALATNLFLPEPAKTADGYYNIATELNNATQVRVILLNKAYVNNGVQLDDNFLQISKQKFLTEVEMIDFSQKEAAANTINKWVEDHTQHKIKQLFKADDFSEEPDLVLANTLYFKGHWADKMTLESSPENFYTEDGNKIQVNMMRHDTFFNFKEDRSIDAKILEMPFEDQRFSILFALPNKGSKLSDLENKFKTENPPDLLANLQTEHVTVKMPRFKIEQSLDLEDVLKKIGLGELFDRTKSQLTGIAQNTRLAVSKAVQKVVVDVNEEGCEAAATTGFSLVPVSVPQAEFIADHPFLFSLIERSGGAVNILFSGRVSNPQY